MDKYLIEPSFIIFSPFPLSPTSPHKHTQLNYAVKAPADASGKVPEAEPPVLYSTVKTEDWEQPLLKLLWSYT